MSNQRGLAIINLISFIFLLGASAVFSMNGNMLNDGSIMPIFMPAGYAFSIWFLIYVLLGIWVLKGFWPNAEESQMYEEVGYWFALAMLFTGLTILVPLQLSPFVIVAALVTSLVVYRKVSNSDVPALYRVPFSFLTGWLSVATIVNISLVLKEQGITEIAGIGEVGWAIIMLGIGAVLAVIFSVREEDSIYPLVFIWGYIAIAIQNADISAVVRMALIMVAILIIVIVYNLVMPIIDRGMGKSV